MVLLAQESASARAWRQKVCGSGLTDSITLRFGLELQVYFLSQAQRRECKSQCLRRDAAQPAIVAKVCIHTHIRRNRNRRQVDDSASRDGAREEEREK